MSEHLAFCVVELRGERPVRILAEANSEALARTLLPSPCSGVPARVMTTDTAIAGIGEAGRDAAAVQ